jgi:hypothetical protein
MAYKIIELEIDDNILSGQTGVESVALVELPAIETEFMYFGRQMFYQAPDYVSKIACRAIAENEKRGNPAATQVGKIRAQQLCNQSEISLDTIKRMKSYLERAATYNTGNWDDNGTISYGLWGGEEALKWVDTILRTLENQEMDIDVSTLPPYNSYPTGNTKNDMLIKPILFVEKIAGESKDDYLNRCIPYVINEGHPQEQAIAICEAKFTENVKCGNCKQSMEITPNPCWDGYEPYGLKPDGSPNCIPVKNSKQEFELLGYMDGVPYFSSKEEAIIYGKETYNCDGYHTHIDENGNEVYMSCATHGDIPDNGVELESLINEGWVITDARPVNKESLLKNIQVSASKVTEEKFYQIVSDPNENSIMDSFGIKIRYVYVSGLGPDLIRTSREFCKRMLGQKQYVFRWEDIMRLNAQISSEDIDRTIIPRPIGSPVDIMDYKGGANCRHYWMELIFGNMAKGQGYEEKITNRKNDEIRKAQEAIPSPGLAGQVNPRVEFNKGFNDTIIVDIDDTLLANRREPMQKVIDYVNSKYNSYRISIVSARNENTRDETARQLLNAGVRYDDLYLVESPSNKKKKAEELIKKGFRIVEAIENNPQTRQDYKSLGIKVTNPESFSMVPSGYIQGLPVFEDKVNAEDYSFQNGCGGITESVMYAGKKMFQACSYSSSKKEEFTKMNFASDDEKRMIYTPLMLPNILIPRLDDVTGEKYYVKFTPETIEKIQKKFMIEGRQRETNLEHTNKSFNDIVMVESWIVTSQNDKIYSLGFTQKQVPIGSWCGGYYVLPTKQGDMIWNDLIKTGKVKGVSVEGIFELKFFMEQFGKTKDDVLLKEIIDILESIVD